MSQYYVLCRLTAMRHDDVGPELAQRMSKTDDCSGIQPEIPREAPLEAEPDVGITLIPYAREDRQHLMNLIV
jgi:hypothetical protein